MAISSCVLRDIYDPINDTVIARENLGYLIASIDMLVVISFLIFIQVIESSQKAYAKKFKDQTIEMDDFTLRIKNLPVDTDYANDQHQLRGYLMHHFEKVIADQKKEQAGEDFDTIDGKKDTCSEIIDINFGGSMGELEHLNGLCDLRSEFNVNNIRIKRCKNEIDKAKLELQQEVLKQKFNDGMALYKEYQQAEAS